MARPYRLWNANLKQDVRWRYYQYLERAHTGALITARDSKVGVVIELYNFNTGKLLGQYKRTVNSVDLSKIVFNERKAKYASHVKQALKQKERSHGDDARS